MATKSSAYYQRLYRQRLREQGLVKKEVWILPEHAQALTNVEKRLRRPHFNPDSFCEEEMSMSQVWTVQALSAALSETALFKDGGASIELLQGSDPSLHITMHDYGDLPLFIAIFGEQIVVEALLWPAEDVTNTVVFNEEVLRSHRLFPLSSIGLETLPDGRACYTMFGALSAGSMLANVIEEIEILADNVIKATEAYENFLKADVVTS